MAEGIWLRHHVEHIRTGDCFSTNLGGSLASGATFPSPNTQPPHDTGSGGGLEPLRLVDDVDQVLTGNEAFAVL
ncbi:hypothetical protein EV643_12664 [Kribbella sp. VKM Ac-2527]|uniref:Uncharacterized protein n=1 Tax=Kribbella caucasensis TaxID=2512215 RepID=A0A4R6JJF4_9ACTN|nr:hypothetical protein EV643_12664 [Kribbella sp. VKM Ac-2527]